MDNNQLNPTYSKVQDLSAKTAVIRVIDGQGWLFLLVYRLLSILFYSVFIFTLSSFLLLIILFFTGTIDFNGLCDYSLHILALDFKAMPKTYPGATMLNTVRASYLFIFAVTGFILSLITGVALMTYETCSTKWKLVAELLPGRRMGYIPAKEGIYQLRSNNLITRRRYYSLSPWHSLSLYSIEDEKKRIYLKTGHKMLCLEGAYGKDGDYYDELQRIINLRLPEKNKKMDGKMEGYRCWLAAVLLISAIGFGWLGAYYYESVSLNKADSEICDVSGDSHLYLKEQRRYP